MKNELKKNIFWQAVRGLCIIAVIIIHLPKPTQDMTVELNLWRILRQMVNFPVAVFVFMSGYFTNAEKCRSNPGSYLINRGGA